jgi:hypothetical protein
MPKINNDSLKLCYIEKIQSGPKIKDFSYRLYFTEKIDDVVGEDWDLPCSNIVTPPHDAYINETYLINTKKLELDLLEDNDQFCYNDGADGIIALGYEIIENEGFHKRLVLNFGDTTQEVEDKLFSREIVMEIE